MWNCTLSGNKDAATTPTDLDCNPPIINGVVEMGAYEFTIQELPLQHLITQVS